MVQRKIIAIIMSFLIAFINIIPSSASENNIKNTVNINITEDNSVVKIAEYEYNKNKYLAIKNKEIGNINIKIIDKTTLQTSEEYLFEDESNDNELKGKLVDLKDNDEIYLRINKEDMNTYFIGALAPTVSIVASLIASISATVGVAIVVVAAKEVTKVLIDKFKDKNPFIIYRTGSGSYTNLTPRQKDTGGLSYTTVKPEKTYTATTVQAINATGKLVAVKDGATHVSVKPVNMSKMTEWINSRENAEARPHEYTKILRKLSVKVR